jgi:hypothetical protein
MKRVAVIFLMVVVAVPVAVTGTFLMAPVWRWVERTWSLEAIGHSGPATWCFVTTYAVVLGGMLSIRWLARRGTK